MKTSQFFLVAFSFGLASLILSGLLFGISSIRAASPVHFVSPDGNCANANPCYVTIQAAVDAAQDGDEIRIAGGVYTGMNHYAGLSQLVFLTKSLTLRGGYAVSDWGQPTPEIYSTTLDAEKAGRVFYISGPVSVTIEGMTLINGDASGLDGSPRFQSFSTGGGLYAISATVTITNTFWQEHLAYVGGAIYVESGQLHLQENTLSSNHATLGGGVFLESWYEYFAVNKGYLYNNTFISNTAEYGGGLSIYGGYIEIVNNRIIGNQSSYNGGGILAALDAKGLISHNVISNNDGGSGGGASLSGDIRVFDNVISGNRSEWGGGIALWNGAISLINNQIVNNVSSWLGGGIAQWYGSSSGDPVPKILVKNVISGNSAVLGGGIFLESTQQVLTGNIIRDNTAEERGGGLYLNSSRVQMNGDIVVNNSSQIDGGGIYLFQRSHAILRNLILARNQAAQNGSALMLEESYADIAHATIADNDGNSGIFNSMRRLYPLSSSHISITNTVLVSHTVGITSTAGSTVMGSGILWFGNEIKTGGAGSYQLSNQIEGDPAFIADTYRIGPSSAARDAGIPTDVFDDIDDEPRPYLAPDLGADEYWPDGLPVQLFAPLFFRQ